MALLRLWRWRRGRSDRPTKAARPSAPPPAPSELTLAQSPPPGGDELRLGDEISAPAPRRAGARGFDPYSNDAGFAKPHAWERVDQD